MNCAEASVDLVINVFERTYRSALTAESITEIRGANRHPFERCDILINNVEDPGDAACRARALAADGLIDDFEFVANRIDSALAVVGLRRSELEPLLHYSDGPLVAATLPNSPWMLYWDPEARLVPALDWISAALELMRREPHVIAANPSWEQPDENSRRPSVERETVRRDGDFAIGHGFSDQVFLAPRERLARPIYGQRCISRIAYPGAHKAHVFEARLGAHMRHDQLFRATSLSATYVTEPRKGTSSYPPSGILETMRYARNGLALRLLRLSPWRPSCLRHTWI